MSRVQPRSTWRPTPIELPPLVRGPKGLIRSRVQVPAASSAVLCSRETVRGLLTLSEGINLLASALIGAAIAMLLLGCDTAEECDPGETMTCGLGLPNYYTPSDVCPQGSLCNFHADDGDRARAVAGVLTCDGAWSECMVCLPGTARMCLADLSGRAGTQICLPDGSGFEPCN